MSAENKKIKGLKFQLDFRRLFQNEHNIDFYWNKSRSHCIIPGVKTNP